MSVNGISGYSQLDAYNTYAANNKKTASADNLTAVKKQVEETGAVYESSNTQLPVIDAGSAVYTSSSAANDAATIKSGSSDRSSIVQLLQADAEAHTKSLYDMVMNAVGGQLQNYGTASSVWQFLASGNYTVTEAAKKQAQDAISEGGYFSVENTSDRILEMAKALAGDDPDMLEKMRDAFKKGYQDATSAWGKELPDISSKTYDAVMSKFDKWAEELNTPAAETADPTQTSI